MTIENISHQGEGVAKIQGYTVFVPFSAPGDKVRAEIISTKKEYARALIQEIQENGQRIAARCPHFTQCGGCDLQHIDYQKQLKIKDQATRSTLQRIGKIDPSLVKHILPSRPWNYRNKYQAPVAQVNGQLTVGLYKPKSHDLVPITQCYIQHQPNHELAEKVAQAARESHITPWDENSHQGILRHIVVRHSEATNQSLIALVVSSLTFPNKEKFINCLKTQLPDLHTLVLNENPRPTNVILGDREEVIWGPGYITDRLRDLTFKISARSFWQVNPDGALKIYSQAKDYAQFTGTETVLDIYCGTGSIGLFMAKDAKQVVGIEINKKAIEDARDNAKLNNIHNAEFHAGKAEDILPQLLKEGLKADVVILDPPRKGCELALLQAVAQIQPQRIVYVSCNPATLARDLKILADHNYITQEIQPVDMFPHTSHVECCCCLVKG